MQAEADRGRERERGQGRAGGASVPELREIAGRVAPVALAGHQLLPVVDALAPLFPGGGLRRGSVVGVAGGPGTGATSLALAVMAAASAAGSWTAAVGLPALSGLAAAELGIDLGRLALVPAPGQRWPTVVAALLDAVDVVAVGVGAGGGGLAGAGVAGGSGAGGAGAGGSGVAAVGRVRTADARRLAARARERGGVLVVVGGWPEGPDVVLRVTGATWTGLGRGHGVLAGRRLEVSRTGRGAAARPSRAVVDLGHPAGPAAGGGGGAAP